MRLFGSRGKNPILGCQYAAIKLPSASREAAPSPTALPIMLPEVVGKRDRPWEPWKDSATEPAYLILGLSAGCAASASGFSPRMWERYGRCEITLSTSTAESAFPSSRRVTDGPGWIC